ncbi:MAG: DUF1080 domain-containing protein, partial [Planctomycetota bacterium]
MSLRFPATVRLVCLGLIAAGVLANASAESPSVAPSPYQSLFNGQNLEGWRGDERFWSVQDGAIVGETSKDNPAPHNTFLIRDGEFSDFELRFSYQVSGFNSGIQYRSVAGDDFKVTGYQADFEARWHDDGKKDKFTGMFFEEGGRMFMGQRGDAVIVHTGSKPKKPVTTKIGTTGDSGELESVIKRDDWNEYVVVARGYTFTHIVNGRVMAVGYDEDTVHRR